VLNNEVWLSQLRVGVDVVDAQDVADSIATFGTKYLHRIYTAHELETCGTVGDVAASRLAARFAAKEALVKVLRPSGIRPDWRSIEVVSAPDGSCSLRLDGSAEILAVEAGIDDYSVSITHEGRIAAAVVIAVSHGDQRRNVTAVSE
jgi:holo-[acyl-carrier protein] synthase